MEGDIDEGEYLLLIEEFDSTCMKQSRFPYKGPWGRYLQGCITWF